MTSRFETLVRDVTAGRLAEAARTAGPVEVQLDGSADLRANFGGHHTYESGGFPVSAIRVQDGKVEVFVDTRATPQWDRFGGWRSLASVDLTAEQPRLVAASLTQLRQGIEAAASNFEAEPLLAPPPNQGQSETAAPGRARAPTVKQQMAALRARRADIAQMLAGKKTMEEGGTPEGLRAELRRITREEKGVRAKFDASRPSKSGPPIQSPEPVQATPATATEAVVPLSPARARALADTVLNQRDALPADMDRSYLGYMAGPSADSFDGVAWLKTAQPGWVRGQILDLMKRLGDFGDDRKDDRKKVAAYAFAAAVKLATISSSFTTDDPSVNEDHGVLNMIRSLRASADDALPPAFAELSDEALAAMHQQAA